MFEYIISYPGEKCKKKSPAPIKREAGDRYSESSWEAV